MEIEVFAKMEDVMENLRNKSFEPTEFSLNISEVDFWGKNTSKK